ncbi:MAG: MFS transporter [Aliidongia sp.]
MLRLAGWFPANGDPALLLILVLHSVVSATLTFSATILVIAMVTDTVEDSQLSTGRRSEGLFLAATSFVTKCATGLGLLVSGALIDLIGFPVHAQPGAVDPAILRNLVLIYTPTTTLLYLTMLGFLSTYRIDRKTHEANLQRLAAAVEASDPY